MSHIQRVTTLASILQGFTIAAMIGLPLAIISGLLTTPLSPEVVAQSLPGISAAPDATMPQLVTVVALNLLSPLILLLALNQMRQLFGHYAKGEVLSHRCARRIQRIGQGLLALAILPLAVQPIQSVLLTLANPPGQRSVSVGINSEMLFFALAGGLIIVIGWAMREASDVAAENRTFV